jgi:DNA-binding transcriptional regulator YiaG
MGELNQLIDRLTQLSVDHFNGELCIHRDSEGGWKVSLGPLDQTFEPRYVLIEDAMRVAIAIEKGRVRTENGSLNKEEEPSPILAPPLPVGTVLRGKVLTELRQEKLKLSRPEFAVEIGVSPPTVYAWEKSDTITPSPENARLLKKGLRRSVLTEEEEASVWLPSESLLKETNQDSVLADLWEDFEDKSSETYKKEEPNSKEASHDFWEDFD